MTSYEQCHRLCPSSSTLHIAHEMPRLGNNVRFCFFCFRRGGEGKVCRTNTVVGVGFRSNERAQYSRPGLTVDPPRVIQVPLQNVWPWRGASQQWTPFMNIFRIEGVTMNMKRDRYHRNVISLFLSKNGFLTISKFYLQLLSKNV